MTLLSSRDKYTIERKKNHSFVEFFMLSNNWKPSDDDQMTLIEYAQSDMGTKLGKVFGPPHYKIEGGHGQNQIDVYFFDFEGHELSCKIEHGVGGRTAWYSLCPLPYLARCLFLDSPAMREFAPDFLCALHKALHGTPLNLGIFEPDIQVRIQSQRDHQVLSEELATVGTPGLRSRTLLKKI